MAVRNLNAIARALPNAAAANPMGAFGGPTAVATGPGGPASPLVASYAEWSTGRANSYLPRDYNTFLAGTFGPLMPMLPQPIDQPAPGEDRPEPRRFTYPTSWNMPHGQPGEEGLKLAGFGQLRVMADAYSVARACIQLRIQEILAIEWDIVPSKDAEKKMRGDRNARRDFDERRAPVKKFFYRPDPGKYHGFESWLSALLEEIFVVDALSLYLQPSRQRGKARGVPGSNLGALCLISGDIVRPMLDMQGGIPQPPNPAWQVYQYGVPRVDLMTSWLGDDVKDMQDALKAEYRADQMMYLPFTPRSWTPYGFSNVEQALIPITSGLQRQQYQLDYYTQGSTPGVFLSTGDPNSTPNQCRELQDALNAMAGDPAWKHKIIVVPGGAKIDPIRPTPLADQFDEIVMTQTCMAFDVMPMELGVSSSASRNAMGAATNIAKASSDINNRKALKPLLKWLKANIFDYVLRDQLHQEDMQWHWEGLEEGEDEAATVDVLVNEMTHGIVSIDEARVIRGHQPWGIPMTSEPVYFTATGITPLGSIDMSTGAPVGAPPTNALQAAAGVVPGAPPAFGPGGPGAAGSGAKPKPKGPNGPKGGGGTPTPAHAGAQAGAAAAARPVPMGQSLPASPKPLPKPVPAHQDPEDPRDRKMAVADLAKRYAQRAIMAREPVVSEPEPEPAPVVRKAVTIDAPAALRELDLIRSRLNKGCTLDGWVPRFVPADVFEVLVADLEKVRLPPGLRNWKEHPWSHGWVWHGPTDIGTKVDHKSFGEGKVVGATKTRVKVEFPDGKVRTFPHAAGVAAGKPEKKLPTSRKPKAELKAVPKTANHRVRGRDISTTINYKTLPPTYRVETDHNDALSHIIAQQGFDGPSRVVSRTEFDAALKNGEVRETWRGIGTWTNKASPETLAEQYRTGDFHVGLGINGDGTYLAVNETDARQYGSAVLRIGLHKDAKVVSAADLDKEMDEFYAASDRRVKSEELRKLDEKLIRDLQNASTERARANIRRAHRNQVFGLDKNKAMAVQRDPGIFAALRGYDAIEISQSRSPDKHHEMILLNRTATIVQEA